MWQTLEKNDVLRRLNTKEIEGLTEEEVKTTMELIKEKNIFAPGGADFASLVSAKVVETDTTNYDLVF